MPFVYSMKNSKVNDLALGIIMCPFQNLIGIFPLYNFSLILIAFFFCNVITPKTIRSNFLAFLNRRLCNLLYSIVLCIIHSRHSNIYNTISFDERLNNYRNLHPIMPHFITPFFWTTKEGILHLHNARKLLFRITAYHTLTYLLKHGPSHPITYLYLCRKDKSRNTSFMSNCTRNTSEPLQKMGFCFMHYYSCSYRYLISTHLTLIRIAFREVVILLLFTLGTYKTVRSAKIEKPSLVAFFYLNLFLESLNIYE